MKLAVIIVNYNVKYFLEQAIKSVLQSSCDFEYEVYVVDNNSADGSVEMVRSRFPEVKLIANKDNTGFSKANNQAIRDTKAEFVLLLNPDTIIQEDTLCKVVKFMDAHPEAGALGVTMIDGKGHFLPESKRGFPSPEVAFFKMSGLSSIFPKSKLFGRYHLGFLDKEKTHKVDVLSGAFMLLRKKVLDQIGLLDEDYFMYGEDIDMSYRIKKAGYENYYFADTSIIHFKGESTKKGSLNYVRVFYQAMIIFARKHITGGKDGLYTYLLQAAIYIRAIMAVFSRAWKSFGLALLDILSLYGVLLTSKWVWENIVRVQEGISYPVELLLVNYPIYVFIWMVSLFLAGSYDRQSRLSNLWGGLLIGTIAIGFVYGFLNLEFRFSRGMILYGFILGGLVLSFVRWILTRLSGNKENLFFSNKKLVIIGSAEEANRVQSLLQQLIVKRDYLGFISPNEEDKAHVQSLGDFNRMNEILEMFPTDEIIFCAKDLPSFEIVQQISLLNKNIEFKIASDQSAAIIGSNSKDESGDLLTFDIGFKIYQPYLKRLKVFVDLHFSLFFLLICPILVFFQKNKFRFFQNIFEVFLLKKSWVSYCTIEKLSSTLPPILPGVLNPLDNLTTAPSHPDAALIRRLNYIYARDYSPITDFQIVFNSLNKLDR